MRAFGFWVSVLSNGDSLERAALAQWWTVFKAGMGGWVQDMHDAFVDVGVLETWGGMAAVGPRMIASGAGVSASSAGGPRHRAGPKGPRWQARGAISGV